MSYTSSSCSLSNSPV